MKYTILFLLVFSQVFAQSDVPMSLRTQFNGPYGYTIIGNTHNEFDNWQTPVPPCQMLTQSSAVLNLQPNQNIVGAYLYWAGIGDGLLNPTIQLNNVNYISSETSIAYPENNFIFSYFGSFRDITAQVQTTGNATYSFTNLDLNSIIDTYCSNVIYFSGWHIVVVYQEIGLPNVQLNIYDGFNAVNNIFNNGVTPVTISNLNVVSTLNAQMTYVGWNGSTNELLGEFITFNGNLLSNTLNPADNPFNGTNSFTNSTTNWNQDIDTYDISPYINVGDTQANLVLNSLLFRFIQTVVTSIRSELPDATVTINQVTGQELCNNRNVLVECTISNINSNATLPIIPIAFYANNTLLTVQSIIFPLIIGESFTFSELVTIPDTIPDNFTLRVVADDFGANFSSVAESNENNNEATQTITLSTTLITPTFANINPICSGQTLSALSTISTNGISGTWSPALNNLQTTEYTFTPIAGQCASSTTLTITVSLLVTPTFTAVNPICSGATLSSLPTISTNGISGTWSPTLNNLQTTEYTFAPTAGQCASSKSLTITVNPLVTPTFSSVNPTCSGATLSALTTISNNGISGTWSPALNNLQTTVYTFAPTAGQCASSTTLTITVNPAITPIFSAMNPICSGATLSALPTISTNGISGTWSPALNNLQTTVYTFAPTAGQCASSTTLTITVNPAITPIFSAMNPICSGATLSALPTISTNGISGTWSPALNNLQTTVYTFLPTAAQCATSTGLTITVNPLVTPTFSSINPICSGATLSALQTVSTNGISGTWSPVLNNLQTTVYTFAPTAGQCASSTTLSIEIVPNLQPDFSAISLCENDTSFNLNSISPNGIVGSWLPSIVDSTTSGFYTFTPNSGQCANNQTIEITINPITLQDFEVEVSHPFSTNATITVIINSIGNYSFQLDDGSIQSSNIFQNVTSGIHSVTVYQNDGCATSITKNDILIIHYPLFFTPNGDGFNDTWTISDLFLQPNLPIYIFDRYGKLLKQISTIGNGWDGTYNGQLMPSDSYWFTVEYLFNSVQKKFSAAFALKR
ncbi:T9SS type B sorting domain-containing protein [Flavobacterium dankookense]|uniref:Gliding motility-associated-like protein n=1 Tax=Flavobacterium dankookense TaxID=706186 RepID=A0A4R6QCW9_9FLAO|nr:T9SS type B sorting domain-containing protein [Flavobacterium dankookense]TDP60205.1 gliding motility-associated-like protein [Flavobacterium dankookense]